MLYQFGYTIDTIYLCVTEIYLCVIFVLSFGGGLNNFFI